jgi:hypothetical protein
MGRALVRTSLLLVALVGCNHEHDAEPTPQALAKCQAYVDATCARQAQCFAWTAAQIDECHATKAAAFSCDTAVAATETYDACLADVAAAACASSAAAMTPPGSCDKVIVHTP